MEQAVQVVLTEQTELTAQTELTEQAVQVVLTV